MDEKRQTGPAPASNAAAIPSGHIAMLRVIIARLAGEPAIWALTGSVSFALQGVAVPVHDIDLQTDTEGAYAIARCFAEHVTRPVQFSSAERIRSHYGALILGGVRVELMGALQKRLPDGAWERPVDIRPHRRWVKLDGVMVPVLDLAYEEQAYRLLGRIERAELLRQHLAAQAAAGDRPAGEQRA